jgi:hypothetical protein
MIKLILLAILAWYVFKTAGNLIRVLRGQPERPLGPPEPPRRKEDVEDARFVDLP